jgi:hypothetical protein
MSQWFISLDEIVSGPISSKELQEGLEGGRLAGSCLIWGMGQEEWISASAWLRHINQKQSKKLNQKEVGASEEGWHYAIDGASKGPIKKSELIKAIQAATNYDQILVWTKGMKTWSDIYDVEKLRVELGLERRDNPRSPATGTVTMQLNENTTFTAHLKSISAGGIGVFGSHPEMSNGLEVLIEINSDQLPDPISAKAEIQYVTANGYVGFKFKTISDESTSHITSYIRDRMSKAVPNAA